MLFGRPLSMEIAPDDDFFDYEAHAADQLGIPYRHLPLEPVVNFAPERALEALPPGRGRRWLYRGWILSEEEYECLYEAVLERGDRLVVHPSEFTAALYMSEYIPHIEEHTPRTRWIFGDDLDEAWAAARELGPPPWIIKDHVKSAKDHWLEACFIPPGADLARFKAACRALIELRGDRFERGIVIREFVELATTPYCTPERPIPEEYRLVFWQGALIACTPYHDVDAPIAPLNPRRFTFLADRIASPFFTADVARLAGGGWTVIEINDGGCSRMAEQLDPRVLYRALLRDPGD